MLQRRLVGWKQNSGWSRSLSNVVNSPKCYWCSELFRMSWSGEGKEEQAWQTTTNNVSSSYFVVLEIHQEQETFPRCLNLVIRSKDKRLGRNRGSSQPIPSSHTGLTSLPVSKPPITMCCSPVTSIVCIFLSLPTILKSSLDSLSFIFLQSIFYLLFLETAHCKVINNPPIAKTNDYLPV